MNKEQILQALMFYAPQAKYEFFSDIPPEDIRYKDVVWHDLFYTKPTEEELQKLYDESVRAYASEKFYKEERKHAYPTVEEQLDMIYHEGLDAWKAKIKAIKDSIPKDNRLDDRPNVRIDGSDSV